MRAKGGKAAHPLLVLVLAVLLAACSNTPPPPVVSTPIAQTSAPPVETPSQIVVGLDDVVGGYNPHNLGDLSTVTQALSQLLLPSPFRPDDDGTLTLDENLMTSAEVTSEEPFTVTYRIRPEASWSDGAPIAVEDFVYLAEAMKTQPGVVDPAGYRLISSIEPGEGGKLVEVTFSEPYPGWKTLFDNLLPSHALKDAPGGWQGALADSFPAYGGPFSIKTVDKERGEIILERNERYWAKPAAVDRIVLHRSDQQGMAAALRSGTDQFVLAATDADGVKLFSELGEDAQSHTVARPYLAEVLLRPVGPALADDKVRAGIAALLDRDRLIAEGTQGGPSSRLRAGAQVLAPSAEGYAPTIPAGPPRRPAPRQAERLLTEAGYTREAGTWVKDGQTLSLVVASPGQQEPYARIAEELSRQLIAAGVEVTTVRPPSRELFSTMLAAPVSTTEPDEPTGQGRSQPQNGEVTVDIAVVPRPVSADPASTLASTFGCGPGWDSQPPEDSGLRTPANPAALCDEELQPVIDAALSGTEPLRDSLAELEPRLWQRNVAIPLFQLADTLAIGSTVSGVTPGPPLVGPFSSAVNWTRGPR
ncbi:ABC-type dipeptide transport system, periplasmic component [Saccharomonospora marina XMU15]|uniref:ABC-type dipeptide transport system, periplasmic component n=1 Tax=Saccharomonospora marina XMU15 TaxID=882083 RepID=H5X9U8_9PSEU|nr:ABC transporter family substrate-binding protein [Saccharomonospora marina]EHR52586.1 ABC-type dipeptide transport system, periplasmic component [Saccharomonospora marina XMU15]